MSVPSPARAALLVVLALVPAAVTPGCYAARESDGGGMTDFGPPRRFDPADVALPEGYRIELVAEGLTFPTGVAFDDRGGVYVSESGYSYGEVFLAPRLVRVEPDGRLTALAEGDGGSGPWTAVTWHEGAFYVTDGNVLGGGGRVLRIGGDGALRVLVDGLPSVGDHHANAATVGPDGWLYFGVGTATNSGVVGPDNAEFGWLRRLPDFHDTPCEDVTLTGANFTSPNPLAERRGETVTTGAYAPFGTPTDAGGIVPGRLPCNGAILRVRLDGGGPVELVAWGFRNPFGLAFAPSGALYATDNAYDRRGSRPVFGAGDLLWEVRRGAWHGWPDFHGDTPLSRDRRYAPPDGDLPPPLLAAHPNPPPRPAARLAVHSSSNGLDFSRSPAFGHVGQAFIAQFGDQTPEVGKVWSPVGFRVVRVDVGTGVVTPFAANRGEEGGPASYTGGGGLERPVAVRFDPTGTALYVVDFGVLTESHEEGAEPRPQTGALWRIVRADVPVAAAAPTEGGGRTP